VLAHSIPANHLRHFACASLMRDLRNIEGDKVFSVVTLAFFAAESGEAETILWGQNSADG